MLGNDAVVAVAPGAMVSLDDVKGPLEVLGIGVADGALNEPPHAAGTSNAHTAATRTAFILANYTHSDTIINAFVVRWAVRATALAPPR